MAASSNTVDEMKNTVSEVDSLMNHYKTWCELRSKLYQYKAQLWSSQDALSKTSSDTADDSVDTLRQRIGILSEEVLELSTNCMIKSSLMESMQLGHTTLEALFPSESKPSSQENSNSKEIQSLISVTTELVSKIRCKLQEVKELEATLVNKKSENAELLLDCRELCRFHGISSGDSHIEISSEDKGVARAMRECKYAMDKLEIIQNCFRGLILGSGIDIGEDAQLRAIVFELGQNVDDLVT